jgi:hypothetical protein
MERTGGVVLRILLVLGMGVSVARAQSIQGTILGTVRDSTGALIPGSTVTVRNVETGFTRTGTTEANGSYRFPALSVGTYEIRAQQEGFQAELRTNVALTVGQEAVVNFSLQVGAITQTVEVVGEAPLVNTTNATLGALVNSQQITDLPLNGRNYNDLTLLQPGVVSQQVDNKSISSRGDWISINGAPLRSNNYMMDGAPIQNIGGASSASASNSTLGIEAIREWRVVTNPISAEYGNRMGGQMTIVSKGGTNNFHGSAFWYVRNDIFDARNFFDYKTEVIDRRLPAFRRNQFGGSVGGPIKRDKFFLFGNYESLRERLGATSVLNTLPAGCHGAAGATITNTDCPPLGSTASVTVSPVTAPLLALYPLPNLPRNRVTYPFSAPTDEHYGTVRADYNISSNDSAFLRYTADDAALIQASNFEQFRRTGLTRDQHVTLSETHIFGPAMVGTFRFSFIKGSYTGDTFQTSDVSDDLTFVSGQPLGELTVPGTDAIGGEFRLPNFKQTNLRNYSADLHYTKGRHNLKFGGLANHYAPMIAEGGGTKGSMSYATVANFLQARADRLFTSPDEFRREEFRFVTLGFYVQDDFRVLPNLTLNLGLRYEPGSVAKEVNGFNSSLRDIYRDTEFTVGPIFENPTFRNIAPRFGFAWDVKGDGRTAVRGGFGILYDVGQWGASLDRIVGGRGPWSGSTVAEASTLGVPFIQLTGLQVASLVGRQAGTQVQTYDYNIQSPHMLSYNFAVERELPSQMGLTVAYSGSRGINLENQRDASVRPPTVQEDGRFYWAGTEPLSNPRYSAINYVTGNLDSFYNSLQVTLRKQLGGGLQFQSAYTWSKLIDERGGGSGGDGGGSITQSHPLLPKDIDRGQSSFTLGHSLRTSAVYRVPRFALTGIAGGLLNGWWTSGILTIQDGTPFSVSVTGQNRSRRVGRANRPNLNPGRNNSNITSGTTAGCNGVATGQRLGGPDLYYDPCAFSLQQAGFLGNAGMNILTAPGLFNLDFSLVKDTALARLGESGALQFRVETFNIFNRTNFVRPSQPVFSSPSATVLPNSGRITATSTKARTIQFALRLLW